jgi:hypothetical protein
VQYKVRFLRIIKFLLALAILTGCEANSVKELDRTPDGWFVGENLITPYSDLYSDWVGYVDSKPGYYSQMWEHPTDGFNNSYIVHIWHNNKIDLDSFRNMQDSPGKKNCEQFQTILIEHNIKYSSPSILWGTKCKLSDGRTARIIHLAIQGTDSLYHVQKIWRVKVEESDIKNWTQGLTEIYICDTRTSEKPCPKNKST